MGTLTERKQCWWPLRNHTLTLGSDTCTSVRTARPTGEEGTSGTETILEILDDRTVERAFRRVVPPDDKNSHSLSSPAGHQTRTGRVGD